MHNRYSQRQLIHDDPNHPQTVDEQTNYLVHIETGKRIYQLYAELDQGEESIPVSLASLLRNVYGNDDYRGPWAFRTLGGAGGQTVFGALTTGTHGGDHRLPPIADDVAPLHLVTDGGKHYWIEPLLQPEGYPLTDDAKLREEYGSDVYGGRENFKIRRDDVLFNAVLVSAGRFGIVYSIVLRAVRQYSLHEERRLAVWQDIPADGAAPFVQGVRGLVGNPSSELYSRRFLQIAICLTSHKNFQRNRCGITKRWNVAPRPDAMSPNGRSERVGAIVERYNFRIQGPRFEFAGNSHAYSPDPSNPNKAAPPDFLERACASADFIEGIINTICAEIREFLNSGEVIRGTLMAEVLVPGVGSLLLLAHALTKILEWLMRFWAHASGIVRIGDWAR
jgi:hypothetical protein